MDEVVFVNGFYRRIKGYYMGQLIINNKCDTQGRYSGSILTLSCRYHVQILDAKWQRHHAQPFLAEMEALYNICFTLYVATSNEYSLSTQVHHFHGMDLDYMNTDNNMKTGLNGKQKCAKAEYGYNCNGLVLVITLLSYFIFRPKCNTSFGYHRPKIGNRSYARDLSYSLTHHKTTCYIVFLLNLYIYKN